MHANLVNPVHEIPEVHEKPVYKLPEHANLFNPVHEVPVHEIPVPSPRRKLSRIPFKGEKCICL